MVVVVVSAGVKVVVLAGVVVVVVVGDAVIVEELNADEVGEDDGLDVGDGYEKSDEEGDDNVGEWVKVWGNDEYQECAKRNEI
jgi:hypothetical protein